MQPRGNIVITSANCATAGLLIPRLQDKGYHVTGLIRTPAAIGADETISNWMNSTAAKKALATADSIIHLSGDANGKNRAAYGEANYTTTKLVTDSIRNEKRQRIIYLSYANAGPGEENLYLHYKGEAEQLLLHTGKEAVIFRCPVIIDAPGKTSRIDDLFIAKKGKAVPVLGNGLQKIRPLYRGDVVNIIEAALEKGQRGVYDLSGPEEMTVNDLIRLANRDPNVKMRHIPAWIVPLLSRLVPGLSPTFADLMLHHTNSIYSPGTFQEFGVAPTSITSLWG
ncbi:MAG TPA: NAD-dependent epimerase/dehydratase family protein [Puia sp.]|jgi:NADH dehydrogenase